jgi:hypothetical protein
MNIYRHTVDSKKHLFLISKNHADVFILTVSEGIDVLP